MFQDDLFMQAAPLCSECEQPICSTEICWHLTDEDEWTILSAALICPNNHRTAIYDAS